MPLATSTFSHREQLFPAGLTVLGVVPANRVWLVKEWVVQQTSAGVASYELLVRRGSSHVSCMQVLSPEFGRVYVFSQRHVVLEPGDALVFSKGGPDPGQARVMVTGARLIGPAAT